MNNTLVTKAKKFLFFLIIISIIAWVTYLIVYKASVLPKGYDIAEVHQDSILLKSFNVAGIEKDITNVTFSEKDAWKIDAIVSEINRQKEFLWMLFFIVSVSLFLLVYKLCNGTKLWKAIFESNIIVALIPLTQVISSLNRIGDLIS